MSERDRCRGLAQLLVIEQRMAGDHDRATGDRQLARLDLERELAVELAARGDRDREPIDRRHAMPHGKTRGAQDVDRLGRAAGDRELAAQRRIARDLAARCELEPEAVANKALQCDAAGVSVCACGRSGDRDRADVRGADVERDRRVEIRRHDAVAFDRDS